MDPKIDPMLDPVLGEVLEVSWHHLGGILGRFGVSFGRLGPSWGGLGLSLECLWGFGPSWVCVEGFLAASWGCLGASCGVFGCLGGVLGRLLAVLGASWGVLPRKRWPTWLQLGPQNGSKIN